MVRMIQGRRDGRHDRQHFVGRHPTRILLVHQRVEVGPVHVVHRDPQLALEFTAILHPHDMRVP